MLSSKNQPNKHRHLKALYVNRFVNGKPMSKIMVDGGAAVNIISMTTFKKFGMCVDDLIKINVILKHFEGDTSETQGVQPIAGKGLDPQCTSSYSVER
jgi:hypothetical protein